MGIRIWKWISFRKHSKQSNNSHSKTFSFTNMETFTLQDYCEEFEKMLKNHQSMDEQYAKHIGLQTHIQNEIAQLEFNIQKKRIRLQKRTTNTYNAKYKQLIVDGELTEKRVQKKLNSQRHSFIEKYIIPLKEQMARKQRFLEIHVEEGNLLSLQLSKSMEKIQDQHKLIEDRTHSNKIKSSGFASREEDDCITIDSVEEIQDNISIAGFLELKKEIKQTINDREYELFSELNNLIRVTDTDHTDDTDKQKFRENVGERMKILEKTIRVIREVQELTSLVTPIPMFKK